ncbi:hypothetical protein SEA_ANNADREAMY_238 [Streptomyces phage Annadreamy]|uniref:Uncharacterized protein n=2 Tax=Annadreamyvirus annadreamy TaxID=2846392 RepID=A0A345GTT0_9CAUD|nr:hypothetical protein HWB75_gp041 [Streptomyces phage Annadreamy]AXG66352.1 hypothetical protein SEA_ANNADREAMY_238 [Streptomyces phage Annadreamy]QGH79545.1 hypothetical protein SEA_LIMPID_244 [Streptomyces phage Limpid]
MAIETVLKDTSDAPWSLAGWTVRYKQVGEFKFHYLLISPKGEEFGHNRWNDRHFRYEGVGTIEELIEILPGLYDTKSCIEQYLAKHGEVKEYSL